jgi:hypothetical protein
MAMISLYTFIVVGTTFLVLNQIFGFRKCKTEECNYKIVGHKYSKLISRTLDYGEGYTVDVRICPECNGDIYSHN